MRDWLSRKGSRLLDMMSQRRRLAKYADPGAHRRGAPERDAGLPINHTRTPMGPMGGGPFHN
jgi:gamma-glutamyl phosphate reductase